MITPEKAYRRWLGSTLVHLSDCRFNGEGWTDSELQAFRTQPKKAFVERERYLAFPEKLYRSRYTLRSSHLREHMARTADIEVVNSSAAETILASFVASDAVDFPFPNHREEGRVYFLLDVEFVQRHRLVRILDLLAAELQVSVVGRPTLWHSDGTIDKRGDSVLLPRCLPSITPFPARSVVEYYRAKHYTPPLAERKDDKTVRFCVPENIDAIISQLPPKLRRYEDNVRLIFSTIRLRWATWQADEDGYVRLNVDILRRFIHPHKEKLLRYWLCDNGFLLVKDQERDGRQLGTTFNGSLKYAIPEQYDFAKWHLVECRNQRIAKKLKSYRRRGLTERVHRYIDDCLDGVSIDMKEATAVCHSIDQGLLAANKELRFSANMTIVESIALKQFNASVCDKGRIHTPITSADRRIRRILRFNGEPIAWTDIRNSQPLLFGLILLNKALFGGEIVDFTSFKSLMAARMGNEHLSAVGYGSAPLRPPPTPITPYTFQRDDLDLHPDELKYIHDCEEGRFYEQMMDAMDTPMDRDNLKEVVFRDVFYSNTEYNSVARTVFASLYPNVMKTILDIRRRSRHQKGIVPCMMQFIESRLIINTVGKRLMEEGIPFLTLHDAIGCSPRHIERVIEVIREEYLCVGLRPSLQTEGESSVSASSQGECGPSPTFGSVAFS